MSDLLEEIEYLKKSLKNKRKGEIWEQCVQFYRNHVSAITNFHIIKLIKIAFRPLKWTILKSCKYISKLSIRHSSRSESKKSMGLMRDQLNNLKIKVSALSNLLQSYTASLQSLLSANDSIYFKMIFRQNYHIKKDPKNLIFEPASPQSQILLQKKKIQHQVGQFLKFVLQTSLLISKSIICCTPLQQTIRFFKQIDRSTQIIFESSHKFAIKKLELDILKLNVITNQKTDYKICYQIPIEVFYRILKDYKKIESRRMKHLFNLLIRYLFIAFLNVNHNGLIFQPSTKPFSAQNCIQTEIFLFMKQILFVYNYVNIKQKSLISKPFLETISAFVESYEMRFEQSRRWIQFLKNYFNFQWLKKVEEEKSFLKEEEVLQIVNIALNRKEQQKINKIQLNNGEKMNKNKVSFSLSSCQKALINHRKMNKIIEKVGNSFVYIQQSDDDQEGLCSHKFELLRRQKILELDMKGKRRRKQDQRYEEKEDSDQKNGNLQVIENLIQQCKTFSSETVKALQGLRQRKRTNSQILRLRREDEDHLRMILKSKQNVQNSAKEDMQNKDPQKRLNQERFKKEQQDFRVENEISLPDKYFSKLDKKPQNSQKILISLSDKYDHLRKTLLLNSKKKNLFI